MKHRDRVLTALHHEAPDRCPMQVSFTPEFSDRLHSDLQLKGQKVHNPHGGGNTYGLEIALGEDLLQTRVYLENLLNYAGVQPEQNPLRVIQGVIQN